MKVTEVLLLQRREEEGMCGCLMDFGNGSDASCYHQGITSLPWNSPGRLPTAEFDFYIWEDGGLVPTVIR